MKNPGVFEKNEPSDFTRMNYLNVASDVCALWLSTHTHTYRTSRGKKIVFWFGGIKHWLSLWYLQTLLIHCSF